MLSFQKLVRVIAKVILCVFCVVLIISVFQMSFSTFARSLIVAIEIGMVYGVLALGIYLTFRTINFPDLTCDGSFITGAAVSAICIKSGCSPFLGLVLAMFAGCLSGVLTGVLHVRLKIDDLLSGIIVAFMLYSLNLRIMGANPNISLVDEKTIFELFECGNSLMTSSIIVTILLVFLTILLNSDFGLGLRSVGQNKQFASANGVNINSMIIFGLALSNALVGMCGAIFTQYQGFCDVSQGVGCLVIGLASVIIGEKLMSRFRIDTLIDTLNNIKVTSFLKILIVFVSCVLGSVVYRVFIAIAVNSDIFGLRTQDLNLITGLLIIFVMSQGEKKKRL